jgi:DNA-binding beta-propeller fold protein YncE
VHKANIGEAEANEEPSSDGSDPAAAEENDKAAEPETIAVSGPEEIAVLSTENEAEDFCELDTDVCGGILFDREGNMLAARPLGLDKVASDGSVVPFCDLSKLEKGRDYYFKSPFIWDMKYDSDNNIIAAAQDRILKIDAEGNVTTLIREDFRGFLGASGLEVDREGNIYVVSGQRVFKYSADLEKTEYLSSDKYYSFFSIAFSPDHKYLYLTDFNTKALVRYDISDGIADKGTEIVREPVKNSGSFGAPLNMIFNDYGSMFVSIDGMGQILKIDKNGALSLISVNKTVSNHIIAFGSKGFDENCVYFTTYGNKVCKLKLDEG